MPFVYQCEKSGIGDTQVHEILWYKKRFTLGEDAQNREIFLHFEAVDYEASVYLNGEFVGKHEGGYTPFAFNLTPYLVSGEQELTVRVYDPAFDEPFPEENSFGKKNPRQYLVHPRVAEYGRVCGWNTQQRKGWTRFDLQHCMMRER